jgi:hypothetical protein
VNDQAAWDQALTAAISSYDGFPPAIVEELNNLIETIFRLKEQLVELATTAGSTLVCRECQGECCRYGKFHVSVLDILIYLKIGTTPVTPDFSTHPACPYSDSTGCTMPPGYRPMTCVVFNCPLVEEKMTPENLDTFKKIEQTLRHAIRTAEQLTGARLGRPLLLSCS